MDVLKEELEFCIKYIPHFSKKFLLLEEVVRFFHHQNILANIGRGSSESSLINYCLNITLVDPLEYKLDYRRFLGTENEPQTNLYVDIDVPSRDELINYLGAKYEGKVYFMGINLKNTIKKAVKETLEEDKFGFTVQQKIIKEVNSNLVEFDEYSPVVFEEVCRESEVLQDFFKCNQNTYDKIYHIIGKNIGIVKHVSALIFSDTPLPIYEYDTLPVTEPNQDYFSYFFKINILKLKVLEDTISFNKFKWQNFEDPRVFEYIEKNRDTIKCFSTDMYKHLWAIAPNFEFQELRDIAIANVKCYL